VASSRLACSASGTNRNWSPERECYINRLALKVFSVDYLDDHDITEIAAKLDEPTSADQWTFVFNVEPSDSGKEELTKLLDV
jgi:hypothetical protein